MDNSLKTKEKTPKRGANAPRKRQTKTFLIGEELKTKDLRQTAERARGRGTKTQSQKTRIAYAERRVKPPARLLRCATALRVTAPHGCGSRRLVWPKGSLSALALTDDLIGQTKMSPAAVLGRKGGSTTAKRGSEYFRQLAAKRKTRAGGRPRKARPKT